jgi:hypothetical protein
MILIWHKTLPLYQPRTLGATKFKKGLKFPNTQTGSDVKQQLS